ncbi:MAG: hypothetical protein SAK29_11345 [Scytonema sp. PMC 1069.18]|nr:hypothetical protein [Scytonema sp. PMC 1069.18]MEC4883676.1 hypothetical protein [Scytonema sp. PMC 1070.18]
MVNYLSSKELGDGSDREIWWWVWTTFYWRSTCKRLYDVQPEQWLLAARRL